MHWISAMLQIFQQTIAPMADVSRNIRYRQLGLLEVTAICSVKLRLYTFKSRLKTHLFSTAFC